MHIGYVRVSKSDDTQTLEPQLDAGRSSELTEQMLAAGIPL